MRRLVPLLFGALFTAVSHSGGAATEGDNVTPQRAYADARKAANASVRVPLEERLAQRWRMEGAGTMLALVPDRFIKVRPGYRCSSPSTPVAMTDTEWILVRLGDQPIVAPDDRRVPTLRFLADGKVAGYDSCNRLAGQYTQEGDKLAFGPLAATRMACPPWGDVERSFTQALGATAGARVLGQHLELLDANGRLLARFDARAKSAPK